MLENLVYERSIGLCDINFDPLRYHNCNPTSHDVVVWLLILQLGHNNRGKGLIKVELGV